MSASFTIKASIGSTVIAEDTLFTASHPGGVNTINKGWTKTPMYAPLSAVPLKGAIVDQFRRAAAAGSEAEIFDQVEALETEREKLFSQTFDLTNEREFTTQS